MGEEEFFPLHFKEETKLLFIYACRNKQTQVNFTITLLPVMLVFLHLPTVCAEHKNCLLLEVLHLFNCHFQLNVPDFFHKFKGNLFLKVVVYLKTLSQALIGHSRKKMETPEV